MKHSSRIDRYLQRYGVLQNRILRMSSAAGIERAVVIPALAESASLFKTLAGLAANPPEELAKTLVLCVVNNYAPPLAASEDIHDNQRTLSILEELLRGAAPSCAPVGIRGDLEKIAGSALRLSWIDASSPGFEIPEGDGGVGTARKIGMDAALPLLDGKGPGGGMIFCLDADTLVEGNYLAAVDGHFSDSPDAAAVVRYAHQMPMDPLLLAAICRYEVFLRAYVLGLSFAGSPYAFHSIGSTMICTAQAYVDVRGMNRRMAAEDFHFLNKLAKIGSVGSIGTTTVFPSPRPSARVPFGTGRSMLQSMNGATDECCFHDPRTFMILKEWLLGVRNEPDRDPDQILSAARKIHPRLEEYLRENRFDTAWRNIRRNCPDAIHLLRQFHFWFDGLKTLRLVHHLSRKEYPPVAMFAGLHGLLDRMGLQIPSLNRMGGDVPGLDPQLQILEEMRLHFSESQNSTAHGKARKMHA